MPSWPFATGWTETLEMATHGPRVGTLQAAEPVLLLSSTAFIALQHTV